MAEFLPTSGPLAEELQCSVCLDVFTNPVSTPCGHNFCKRCLNQCWNNSQNCYCPFCKETFSKRPDLKINTALRQVVQLFEEKFSLMKFELFSDLIRSIKRCQAELLEMMEEKQKAAEKQDEELIQELQQEISELKMRDTELDHLLHTEDHLQLLQIDPSLCSPPHTRNWPEISMNTDVSVEALRRALTQLQETLDQKLNESGKSVSNSKARYYYISTKNRGKTDWNLGVARESINRKGLITMCPQNGLWAVALRNGNEYWACAGPSVCLSLRVKPQNVGVFVDYEEGLVSFYDVESRSHIYSFTGQSFTDVLYPYFCPYPNDKGQNSAPLIISPVNYNY
uniref:Uncharacterized protein n=1 Tax=Cyprinus carpio TaxID=7962 RepID=A0A8C2I5R9_CYPCA